jgi:hypothetical protein
MTHGEAFGIGTAVGAGVFAGLLFLAFHR